jgi:hypothetical protein
MDTKLGHGRLAVLLMAFFLALGTSSQVVQVTSVMADIAVSATADGTQHNDCDGCSNPQVDGAGCGPAACALSCGNSTCAILPGSAEIKRVRVLALPELAVAACLTWLSSPDPPPPRRVTLEG